MNVSRSKLLAAGTALAAFGPLLLGPFISAAEAADESDIGILQVAIKLERAGIKAYQDAAGTNLLEPGVLAVAKGFMQDHMAHRDALIGAVKAAGDTPTDETTQLTYPPLKTQADILAFAESVERQAASTYLSVIPAFKDRQLAKVAASILGVETTHVAILAYTLKQGTEPYKDFVS
ncbi:MAG TPA: ferritin-like domain-containing protein [Candidatus Baltobacteraceae bacterium]